MSEVIDYEQLIQKLLEDRANIDRMIAWARQKQQQEAEGLPNDIPRPHPQPETIGSTHYAVMQRFPRLAQDTFFRLSVPDAIKKYLNIAKRPKSAKDITAALEAGGLTHKAKNLYATVYPTLLRMETSHEVVRVSKGEWGLNEWYPGSRKATQEDKTESES